MKEALLVIIIVIVFSLFISFSLSNGEKAECEQWLKQSKEIRGYYVTDWQVKECQNYNIHFNTPTLLIPKSQ